MPNYSAQCDECGLEVDYFRPLAEWDKVPKHCGMPMRRIIKAPQIIKDIEPYKAVAVDIATGKAPRISSRREHREFLRRNNFVEVGNDIPKPKPRTELDSPIRELKQAIRKVLKK
jgi:hypothetical protein